MKSGIHTLLIVLAAVLLTACGEGKPKKAAGKAKPRPEVPSPDQPEPPTPADVPDQPGPTPPAEVPEEPEPAAPDQPVPPGPADGPHPAPADSPPRKVLSDEGRLATIALLLGEKIEPGRERTPEERKLVEEWFSRMNYRQVAAARFKAGELPGDIPEGALLAAVTDGGDESLLAAVRRTKEQGAPADLRGLIAGMLLAEAGEALEAEVFLENCGHPLSSEPLLLLKAKRREDPAALPPGTPVSVALAAYLLKAGQAERAAGMLENLQVVSEDDPRVWETLGRLRMDRDDPEGAGDAFRKAITLDPGSVVSRVGLFQISMAAGQVEEAVMELEAADALPAHRVLDISSLVRVEPPALSFYSAAVWALDQGRPGEQGEALLRRAVESDPTHAPSWIALSELALRGGDLPLAIESLEEGAKPVATGPERAWLMLRLAVRHLQAGNKERFAEILAEIPAGTYAVHQAGLMGDPKKAAPVLLPDWCRCPVAFVTGSHAALLRGLTGEKTDVTDSAGFRDELLRRGYQPLLAEEFDPRPLIAKGTPVLAEVISRGAGQTWLDFALLVGYDDELGVYFTDMPRPWSPVLLLDDYVRTGLLYVPGSVGKPSSPRGTQIARALSLKEKGEFAGALDEVDSLGDTIYPLSVFLREWAAIHRRDLPAAEKLLKLALIEDPEREIYKLLLAQTYLIGGEVGKAVQVTRDLDHLAETLLLRRINALALLRPGTEEKGYEALKAILSERPDYLPVYTDISDFLLPRGRFKEGVEFLHGLGRRSPRVRGEPVYQVILNRAYGGLVRTAVSADDLMPLLDAPWAEVRQSAVRAAVGLAYDDTVLLLGRLIEDEDGTVRTLTLRYCGNRGYNDLLPQVRERLADEEGHVRGAAAAALREIAGMDAAGELIDLLSDTDTYVRSVAAAELRALSGKNLGFLPDGDETSRSAAIEKWRAWYSGTK